MNQELWSAVDDYFDQHLIASDAVLDTVYSRNAAAGLPAIDVSPSQGKFLHMLARIHGAKRVLEIGTLGGYSTIWLGRALPADGKIVTLEINPTHYETARANIAAAQLACTVEQRLGPAIDSMTALITEGEPPFDLIFVDARKRENPDYLELGFRLARPGTLIIVDNVVREGGVLDAQSSDPDIQGVRRFTEMVAAHPRLTATTIQTVGSKGWDGLMLLLVTD